MEWVEVAGKSVEEATELALDQLGVAVGDAEVIVVSEPKAGLFGRMRGEARVRARVRPVGARPRRERTRDRRSKGGQGAGANGGRQGGSRGEPRTPRADAAGPREREGGQSAAAVTGTAGTGTSRSARRRRNRSRNGVASAPDAANGSAPTERPERAASGDSQRTSQTKETVAMAEGMTLEEQGEAGRAFLVGLLSEYGVEATVETRVLDEDTIEIAASGDDLGLLVGPRGSTLSALQDLTRAVVQRQCPSRTDRILVDVAGYREKRSAALKRFSAQIAQEVIASGQEKALEAMSPADRKSVHDAVNEIEGVSTRSEGEDPNRHIVIAPVG
ncbi:MAG TPA: RNA-binding cell elongation regulator Jag/EloR [Acidimicrobiales bacterium]|nr:RNA-binding cell elongation regulator Jag/EloR [Acidimicrobiales bacterium]